MPVRIDDLLDLLRNSSLVRRLRVVDYDETPSGLVELKIRCQLINGYQLQVWLHCEPAVMDYAYQVFTDQPLWRWDNAPHFPRISTAPHHFHDETGQVSSSVLTGEPDTDLQQVLMDLARRLSS